MNSILYSTPKYPIEVFIRLKYGRYGWILTESQRWMYTLSSHPSKHSKRECELDRSLSSEHLERTTRSFIWNGMRRSLLLFLLRVPGMVVHETRKRHSYLLGRSRGRLVAATTSNSIRELQYVDQIQPRLFFLLLLYIISSIKKQSTQRTPFTQSIQMRQWIMWTLSRVYLRTTEEVYNRSNRRSTRLSRCLCAMMRERILVSSYLLHGRTIT
jgi:hypothetical protein